MQAQLDTWSDGEANQPAFPDRDESGRRVAEVQPLRPVLVTLGRIGMLLLAWATIQWA